MLTCQPATYVVITRPLIGLYCTSSDNEDQYRSDLFRRILLIMIAFMIVLYFINMQLVLWCVKDKYICRFLIGIPYIVISEIVLTD